MLKCWWKNLGCMCKVVILSWWMIWKIIGWKNMHVGICLNMKSMLCMYGKGWPKIMLVKCMVKLMKISCLILLRMITCLEAWLLHDLMKRYEKWNYMLMFSCCPNYKYVLMKFCWKFKWLNNKKWKVHEWLRVLVLRFEVWGKFVMIAENTALFLLGRKFWKFSWVKLCMSRLTRIFQIVIWSCMEISKNVLVRSGQNYWIG